MSFSFELLTHLNMEASSCDELLERMADELVEGGYAAPSWKEAVKERERAYPTGLPTQSVGVAIPHTDGIHVRKNALFAATLKTPVRFGEMGGGPEDRVPVECVLAILLCNNDKQLKLLMGLMGIIQNPNDLAALRAAEEPREVEAVVRRYIQDVVKEEDPANG